jgi:O-antigen ligase
MNQSKKIVFGLAFVALLGTLTNFVYFSPLLTLLIPLCIFVVNKERLKRPVAWLYAFTLFFLVGVIAYDPRSLIEFGFYRRDGNFIISYAPLLVLPLFSFSRDTGKYLRRFYIISLSIYAALFAWHVLTTSFGSGLHQLLFGGLFLAQNAAGGFLTILGSLGFAYAWHKRSKKELAFFAVIFFMLLATYSRGSILGLVLGLGAWFLADRGYFKTLAVYLLVPVLFTVGSLMIGYPYYQQQISTSNYVEEYTGEDTSGKNANILIRLLYTFPRAYYSFSQSPIVGAGVGSFDDRPYQFEPVVPYVQYNAQPQKLHTDSHAHHSYLHILAEQGIVGLTLFLTFWISIFWYLVRLKNQPVIRDFLLIAYFSITIASFTEHRITTPSMMLPFTIPLGLVMAQKTEWKTYLIEKLP